MKYAAILTVTQKWRVIVEADRLDEIQREAKLAYERSSNPWEDLEPIGEEEITYNKFEELKP